QVGHPGHAPAAVLLRQPGDPHRDQPDVLVAVQQRPGEPLAGRPQADRRHRTAAGRRDPLPDQPRLGRRRGLGEYHGARLAGRVGQQPGQVVRRGHGAVPGAGHSASRFTYAIRISSMRSRRSRTVQSAVLTGGSTVTSTVPGLSVVELRPATESEFLITIGTTGRPVAIAIRKAPFLNGPTDWVSSRVTSGATTIDRPLRAASSMGASAATAEPVSARSMNAASIS